MTNPDLPPDSITALPREQRTAAIHERYAAFAYSGPTAADRERDIVIGHLLDLVEREAAWIWPKGYRQPRRSRLISRRPEIYKADPLRRLPFWRQWLFRAEWGERHG